MQQCMQKRAENLSQSKSGASAGSERSAQGGRSVATDDGDDDAIVRVAPRPHGPANGDGDGDGGPARWHGPAWPRAPTTDWHGNAVKKKIRVGPLLDLL
jgi:hypothetical protein